MRDLPTSDFVTLLRERGVRVTAAGGKLEIRAGRAGLPEDLRQELVRRKPELLALLGEPPRTAAIEPAPPGEEARLSFTQRRLWFMDQLEGGSAAYNVPAWLELRGPLDAGALARSLAAIVARHEVLRTTLHPAGACGAGGAAGDEPRLAIDPDGRPRALELDLRGLPEGALEAELRRHAALEADTPFDLARDAMLRYRLLRCAGERHVLLLTTHHIACDAWSMSLLLRELATCYRAFAAGAAPELPPLPIQHRDFARWQRGRPLDAQLEYWRGQLREPLPRSLPPPDRPRGAGADLRGALASRTLAGEATLALRRLAAGTGASLFMILGAALAVVLGRRAGAREVLFGMPVAGRERVELEPLLGCFLNQLPLRVDLGPGPAGEPDLGELIERVRRVTLDALANQDVPFERMVEVLRPERAAGQDPLFEVMLNMINTPALDLALAPGVTVTLHEQAVSRAKYPLTLHVRDEGKDLELSLGYQAALFDAATIEVFLDQLAGVLAQAARDPRTPEAAVSLVTEATAPLVADLRAPLGEPRELPVTEQLRARARAAPERPALAQGGRTMSYGELLERAEALARALVARGLAVGDVVAIDGPRSFGGIAGVLGALLAGGAFLNLDPNYPPARQAAMLAIARARFVVRLSDDAPAREGLAPIALDAATGALREPGPPPDPGLALPVIGHDDAAYVFFTSGSTGAPKGVLGWHGALAHFCAWYRGLLGATAGDRVSQLAGLSFDGFLKDVFLALTAGATLCLPGEAEAHDGPDLLRWLAAERVTVASAVPSRVAAWLRDVPPGLALPHLRWLNFAGEPLREELIRRWRAAFPGGARIMNFYGATELTVLNCFHEVPDPAPPGVQCVGRARPDTEAFVMRGGRVAGVGELGEIVLRSKFCTRGYLHDAAQTAERFVPNPAREEPRDRLYRTGDRGRLRPDGTLEVLGRLDDQVKVRGVRVELGEVKACLLAHPAVLECEVVPRKTEGKDDLVAYVVPRPGHAALPDALRAHAAAHLLAAMIPGAFVELAALPLTPNGKVDRAALPPPEPAAGHARRPPATPTEHAVHALWRELLAVAELGVDDNFFDLGGHSLLATQLVSRVRAALGVELTVRAVFTEPTVARLAARIDLLRQIQAPAAPAAAPDDDHERGVL